MSTGNPPETGYSGLVNVNLSWTGGKAIVGFLLNAMIKGKVSHPQYPDFVVRLPRLQLPDIHLQGDRIRISWVGPATAEYKTQLRARLPDLEIMETQETAPIFSILRDGVIKLDYGAKIYLPKPVVPRAEKISESRVRFVWDKPAKISWIGIPLLTLQYIDATEDLLHVEMGKLADIFVSLK